MSYILMLESANYIYFSILVLESDFKLSCIQPVNTVPQGGQTEGLWDCNYSSRDGWLVEHQTAWLKGCEFESRQQQQENVLLQS